MSLVLALGALIAGYVTYSLELIVISIFVYLAFSIYLLYWFYATKNELNELLKLKAYEMRIPTFVLFLIPFFNLYWLYKYIKGLSSLRTRNADGLTTH